MKRSTTNLFRWVSVGLAIAGVTVTAAAQDVSEHYIDPCCAEANLHSTEGDCLGNCDVLGVSDVGADAAKGDGPQLPGAVVHVSPSGSVWGSPEIAYVGTTRQVVLPNGGWVPLHDPMHATTVGYGVVHVYCPGDARIYINGERTSAKGTHRKYLLPLKANVSYAVTGQLKREGTDDRWFARNVSFSGGKLQNAILRLSEPVPPKKSELDGGFASAPVSFFSTSASPTLGATAVNGAPPSSKPQFVFQENPKAKDGGQILVAKITVNGAVKDFTMEDASTPESLVIEDQHNLPEYVARQNPKIFIELFAKGDDKKERRFGDRIALGNRLAFEGKRLAIPIERKAAPDSGVDNTKGLIKEVTEKIKAKKNGLPPSWEAKSIILRAYLAFGSSKEHQVGNDFTIQLRY